MELVEPIERINKLLEVHFGHHDDMRPRFRVVFANDQLEKRWVTHTNEGFQLLHPEVQEVRKYQDKIDRYVLEQLSIVPPGLETDLTEPLSYEPLWTFEDRHGDYLPPLFEMCKFVIDQIYARINGTAPKPIYKEDPDKEAKELKKIEDYLFGDETRVSDDLGLGIAVTDFNPKDESGKRIETAETTEVKPS